MICLTICKYGFLKFQQDSKGRIRGALFYKYFLTIETHEIRLLNMLHLYLMFSSASDDLIMTSLLPRDIRYVCLNVKR